QIQVARSALQVDHDDALGLVPAGAAAAEGFARGRIGLGLFDPQEVGQREAQHRSAADPQNVAPRGSNPPVAIILGKLSGNPQHRRASAMTDVVGWVGSWRAWVAPPNRGSNARKTPAEPRPGADGSITAGVDGCQILGSEVVVHFEMRNPRNS